MDKSLTLQPPATEAREVSRTWQGYLDEMAHLREQLQHGAARDRVDADGYRSPLRGNQHPALAHRSR